MLVSKRGKDVNMNAKGCFGLLLYCLSNKTDWTESRLHRISMSDWDHVIQLAIRHDIAPLLYYRLKKFDRIADVPPTFIQRLQEIYFYNAARNMRLYSDFSEVCNVLTGQGIEVIALKGLHLAEMVYGDVALRQMRDMDLLVRRQDLPRAQDALLEMGYGPESRARIEEQCLTQHHLVPFTKRGAPPIEIHWSITPPNSPFKVDMDELWGRAEQTKIADVPVLLLSPEDLLMHLCLHASFNHKFNSFALKNVCDINETMSYYQDDIDWERIGSTADDPEIARYLLCTLQLVRGLLGTEMPLPIHNIMKNKDSDRELVKNLFSRALFPNLLQGFLASFMREPDVLSMLKSTTTFSGKVMTAFKSFFPSRGHLREKYSLSRDSKKVYLFYLFHLLDVFIRGLLLLIPKRMKERAAESFFEGDAGNAVMRKWSEL